MGKKFNSLKGQLLLDGGKMQGSFFHHTVVLICQHDEEGAFGLVLNRPAGDQVGNVLVADMPESLKDMPLYLGGPVQPGVLSFLNSENWNSDADIMSNIVLGHSIDELIDVGESFSPLRKTRIFAGYSGWSAGQLDDEMRRESWLTHPASLELVFYDKPEELWRHILRQKGLKYRLLSDSPDDNSLN
jgi:putative transcriptional regulator